jgi:hypothetical protein
MLWTFRGLVTNDLRSLQTLGRIEDGSLTDGSGSLSLPTQVRLLYPSSLTLCLTLIPDSLPADEIAKMRQTAPDYKESMEIGRERDPGGVEPKWKNEWPAPGVVSLLYQSHPLQTFSDPCLSFQLDSYKPQMLKFFELNHELQMEVMRSIAVGLKLPEDFFDSKVRPSKAPFS